MTTKDIIHEAVKDCTTDRERILNILKLTDTECVKKGKSIYAGNRRYQFDKNGYLYNVIDYTKK